ncbi:MAG: class I SAM-dependent methyltransferase [Pseudomonadales bacterium]|jgi:SAM-dependent methyltransferase|nr:class I SAM-dependent methyltransferase [Pseudomonadales bacterium]MDP6471271.1 class I SAM-dependent methyltransferase [Pseudomonadales bacterium]MDP6825540.1 class I SAM-dependent methyltransferase [Pseudomonadales bacterium]MDP6972907.1 class I SAM-dependent methyltransferase [Pseudomonadales bacterium]
MNIEGPAEQRCAEEIDILRELLPLADAEVLELGCGAAEKTRKIAEQTGTRAIVAAEVDRIQHARNLAIGDLPEVTFRSYGAEAIDEPKECFDIVILFKSLHHVPLHALDRALGEIHRVLKPGGLVYICEPVYAGAYNEIIRLFHDEADVRRAAFDAVCRAVDGGVLQLESQTFFKNRVRMKHFGQFERGVLGVTHTNFSLTPEILAEVRTRFERHRSDEGYVFEIPNRVDLLRKPIQSNSTTSTTVKA